MDGHKLVRASADYADEIASYRQEFLENNSSMDGCGPLRRFEDSIEYIAECDRYLTPETVPEGKVQATQFFYVREGDGRIVGMIRVRHYFNAYLERYAGHIGYSVRPSERRKGYATEMLRETLPFCREIGISKVLITCIDGNIGSEKAIGYNGGEYESTVFEPNEGVYLKRFWIDLGK